MNDQDSDAQDRIEDLDLPEEDSEGVRGGLNFEEIKDVSVANRAQKVQPGKIVGAGPGGGPH